MKILKYIVISSVLLYGSGCNVLDKKNLEVINEETVWNDPNYTKAYVNQQFRDNAPGWSTGNANNSDEANGGDGIMYGQLTENSIDVWPYENIRNINLFFEKIKTSTIDPELKDQLTGQMHFLRAIRYSEMVTLYGGVPLILTAQQLSDDLLVKRNKTSECIEQIVKDLDAAANLLPMSWTGNDVGRLTKAGALAYKARVLMYWASPQFNPNGDAKRWTDAFDANKYAYEQLSTNGFDLYESYEKLWFTELNCEAVMVKRYNEPGYTHNWDAATRPLAESQNATGSNTPTWDMVCSYPMVNGAKITDNGSGYDPVYYWKNRDPRFYSTIAYNGCKWELSGKSGRLQWNYIGSETELNSQTATGFYCRKAINPTFTPYYAERSGTDWMEIRFAEVMLNYAECAAHTGDNDIAYDMVKKIRKRAGIDEGSNGNYGLMTGLSGKDLVEMVLDEKKVEFAFEGKRYYDLRRNRLFAEKLNGKRRLRIESYVREEYKETISGLLSKINIDTEYDKYFKDVVVNCDKNYDINFKDNYYFYAIPNSHLERNVNLQQTKGWSATASGEFDPLQ